MALIISNLDESPHSRWQTWTEKHWLRCSAAGTLGWWWALGDSGHIDWPGNAEACFTCAFWKCSFIKHLVVVTPPDFFFSWAYLGIPKRKVVGAFFYFYQADWDRPHPETKHMRVSRQLILVCIGCWHFCFSSMKWGKSETTHHMEKILKNFITRVEAVAFGYTWQILATIMAHDTPPKKPSLLE